MRLCIFVIMFCSFAVTATSFVISEIFSNSAGRGSDRGKEWFELAQTTKSSITINQIRLVIVADNQRIFSETIALTSPIQFEEFVVVAQDAQLGFDQCLRNLPVVEVPGFTLPNSGSLEICVALNDDAAVCAAIGKKVARPDGVALFRDPDDHDDAPFFAPEPCFLTTATFATPGMPARACAFGESLTDQVFRACGDHQDVEEHQFVATSEELNLDHIDTTSDRSRVHFSVVDNPEHQPLVATLCKEPFVIDERCVIEQQMAFDSSKTSLINWRMTKNYTSHLILREFHGAQKTIKRPHVIADTQPWRPAVTWSQDRDALIVNLSTTAHDVPLTIWLITDNGSIVHEAAFVAPHERYTISVPLNAMATALRYAAARGHGEMAISQPLAEDSG